jgi:hypothetical protein
MHQNYERFFVPWILDTTASIYTYAPYSFICFCSTDVHRCKHCRIRKAELKRKGGEGELYAV